MNRRRPKSFFFRTARGEQLEPRNMLAGHPMFAVFSPAALGFHPGFQQAGAASAGAHSSAAQQTVLTASLNDPNSSATGTVTYQTGAGCGGTTTTLTVSVTGATAGSTLSVALGGTTIGTLTTDSTGASTLVLSSNPKGSQQTLPTNFPTSVAAGTAVTVGSLSGTFAATTSTTGSAGSNGSGSGCGVSQVTTLTAALTDVSITATGTVNFSTSTSYGTTTTKLTVSVTGATASNTLSVVIGGVTVGMLTTDSTGAGTLVLSSNPTGTEQSLPSNFPTISLGTTVTVGSLSGTFAASTTSSTVHFLRRR